MKDGSEDPYVIIDLNKNNSLVGLTYTAPQNSAKKFSFRNLFSRNTEKVYTPISKYEVYTSLDGNSWTLASSGTFDNTKTTQTVYFSEDGKTEAQQLWSYDARYVKLVAKGKMDEATKEVVLSRISGTTDMNLAADCDLVVEAAIENMEIKKSIFAELDSICKESTILASNTSSLI